MVRELLFILAHQMGDSNFYPAYKKLIQNQWKTYEQLKVEQEEKLKLMIEYAYTNVPYYRKVFAKLKITPRDIKKIEDLQILPVITKDIIKENWEDFKPNNLSKIKYYNRSTGGSTGTPFKYRLSRFDRFLIGAMLYRGWGYAGFKLGDKMVFLGGSSLAITKYSLLKKKAHEFTRNIRMLSSFDMSENEMLKYVQIINSFKPKYIYGYASSIYFFSKWIEQNNINIYQPYAIFTTAEKLFNNMRKTISKAFSCDVYDTYGVNDGGVSAFECEEHNGLHIDMERAVLEVVDQDGYQLESGQGNIIATNLNNFAMPFIRYNTGDVGYLSSDSCSCKRGYKLLKEINGRQQEILKTPEGKYVHGSFFSHIFWQMDNIKEFQIIQKSLDRLIVKIIPEDNFDKQQLEEIKRIVRSKSREWQVEFELTKTLPRTSAGKYKYVINEVSHK